MSTKPKVALPKHVTTHDVFGVKFSDNYAKNDTSDTRTDEQMENSQLPEDDDFDSLDSNDE